MEHYARYCDDCSEQTQLRKILKDKPDKIIEYENSFGLTPSGFPQFITSQSLNNAGGGYLSGKRTIRQLKMDAVQPALEQLTNPEADESVDENERMVRFAALMKRSGDRLGSVGQRCHIKLAVWQVTGSTQ